MCQFQNAVGRAQSAVVLQVEHRPLVTHRYTYLSIYLFSIQLFIYLSIFYINLFIYLSILVCNYLTIFLSIYFLSLYSCLYISIYLSIYLSRYNKVAANPGEPVRIPCKMKAFPAPNFQWDWLDNSASNRMGLYEVDS